MPEVRFWSRADNAADNETVMSGSVYHKDTFTWSLDIQTLFKFALNNEILNFLIQFKFNFTSK